MYNLLIKKKKKKKIILSLQISVATVSCAMLFLRELGQCISYYFNEMGKTVTWHKWI